MYRFIIFVFLSAYYFTFGCSDIHNTPSAIVLKHFESRYNGDIATLQSTMTREAYLTLVSQDISALAGDGKVFEYDKTHYMTDPVSLGRLESKLSEYYKNGSKPTIELISEKALDESSREIYLKLNGKEEMVLLIDIDSQWKISRLPGD